MYEDKSFLSGKHAVVTGGSRGIGAAIAKQLIAQGVAVTIMGRNKTALESQAEAMDCTPVVVDVTDQEKVAEAFQHARDTNGPVDILINNAGAALSESFEKISASHWREMMAVNLDGVFYCAQAAIADMLATGWGRVINIASTAGLKGYTYTASYCAAKHGVVGLTRAMALEFAASELTVNAVCPGFTETDLMAQSVKNLVAKTGQNQNQIESTLKRFNPQQRFIQPEEIADTVLWLCGEQAKGITGQAVAIAGGEVM